jgi:hypothetical protein
MENELKAKIIEELVRDFFNDPGMYEEAEITDFLVYNDLGVPLAQGIVYDLIDTLTPQGETLLQETWENFCNLFDADPDEEYDSLDDVMLYGEDDL